MPSSRPTVMRLAALAITGTILAGCGDDSGGSGTASAPKVVAGPTAMRRLTEPQYRATIADLFGDDIVVAGRVEPDNRREGLLAVGASFVSTTSSGFEQYESIARNVAEQVVDEEHREILIPCEPQDAAVADDYCAAEFLLPFTRRILRRDPTADEIEALVGLARNSANDLGDFYAGLGAALSALLVSPEFLFRVERSEPSPDDPGARRLSSIAMASRLSYLLWNSTPDDELLDAAATGQLVDDVGLEAQVDRLLDSPKVEDSVRAFFSDLYDFSTIDQGLVRKDSALFPAFNQTMMFDASEQTLRVIVDHLLTQDADYRGLFTTRNAFMTRSLGFVYRVPVGTPMGWEPFEFPADGDRAGILSHISLLALYSHPGRSSPTLRGKFVREVILCQEVPPPPGNIDFSDFATDEALSRSTARQRLEAHVANPACAGCHSLMDPIGLGFEKMDGIGASRETENDALIDPSGELDGVPYADSVELGDVISRDPSVGPCLIDSFFKYAMGRVPADGERAYLDYIERRLERGGYRMRELMRLIALSEAFRTTSGPRVAEQPAQPTPNGTPVTVPTATRTATPSDATPGATVATPGPGTPHPSETIPLSPTRDAPRTLTPTPTLAPSGIRFERVQDEILTSTCATQFCHSRQTASAGLVLEEGDAYDSLVGASPTNAAAQSMGFLRVDPGAPNNSFLFIKIEGPADRAFGSRMPLVGDFLTQEEIDLIGDWIEDGALR